MYNYMYITIIHVYCDSYYLVSRTLKVHFFAVMSIFDWPITKKINEAFNSPKIDML
jgi:hypothetical protein